MSGVDLLNYIQTLNRSLGHDETMRGVQTTQSETVGASGIPTGQSETGGASGIPTGQSGHLPTGQHPRLRRPGA